MPERAAYRLAALAFGMRIIGGILSVYAITQALVLIFAHKDRFTAQGWFTAMQVPGAPQTWGVILGLAGVTLAYGIIKKMWRLAAWASFVAGVWSMFFAVTFFISAIEKGNASLTGIPTYLQNALIFVVLGVTLKQQRTTDEN